jgi:hypothetical protein
MAMISLPKMADIIYCQSWQAAKNGSISPAQISKAGC